MKDELADLERRGACCRVRLAQRSSAAGHDQPLAFSKATFTGGKGLAGDKMVAIQQSNKIARIGGFQHRLMASYELRKAAVARNKLEFIRIIAEASDERLGMIRVYKEFGVGASLPQRRNHRRNADIHR